MDRRDDQIPHADQEHKGDNLPTKRATLPATNMRIFMAGHQHETITVQKKKQKTVIVFHQNIKGLVNKLVTSLMVKNLGVKI
jgi:calcineurin-like phosphoesterase family protein